MTGQVRLIDDKITNDLENLFLDFKLVTVATDGSGSIDFSGLKTYTFENFSKDEGFGITNIEIDIQPNLQPIIDITFKDLYGNLVLGRNPKFKYDTLFSLPYPRFEFVFKGYLGKPVSYLLNVKRISTNYIPSDGSYEIKVQFVPNIFGFFNDIPFQYLYAIPKLKKSYNEFYSGDSIVQIAKIGQDILKEVENEKDQFKNELDRLQILNGDPISIFEAYKDGRLSKSGKAETIDNITASSELEEFGFKTMVFNIVYKTPKGNPVKTDFKENLSKELFGEGIRLSMLRNSNININDKQWFKRIQELLKTESNINAVQDRISKNITAIENYSRQQGFNKVGELKLRTQTIGNVMERLAGDAAYILGYIFEGGISSVSTEEKRNQMINNKNAIGIYYPFKEETSSENKQTFKNQVPFNRNSIEYQYAKKFTKALYEGQIESEKISKEIQESYSENNTKIKSPLTGPEILMPNPYEGNNANQLLTNIIQRTGLSSLFLHYDKSSTDFENIKPTLISFINSSNDDIAILKKFIENTRKTIKPNGSFVKPEGLNTVVENGVTFRQYISNNFLRQLSKTQGFDNNMFENSDPNTLQVKYMINNGLMYWNLKDLSLDTGGFDETDFRNDSTTPDGYLVLYDSQAQIQNSADNTKISLFDLFLNGGNIDIGGLKEIGTGSRSKNYNEYWKISKEDLESSDSRVYFDFNKIKTNEFKPIEELVVHLYPNLSNANTATDTKPNEVFKENSIASYYAKADFENKFLIDFNDITFRKFLFNYVINIEKFIDNKPKLIQEQKNTIEQGGSIDSSELITEPYKEDIKQVDTIYTQFHHIFNSWFSLYENLKLKGQLKNGDGTEGGNVLPPQFELLYSKTNSSDSNKFFSLEYNYSLLLANEKTIIRDSLINIDPLLESNAQTSVLSMMNNICFLNNFLIMSIPGGKAENLEDVFKPSLSLDDALGNNTFTIFWTPTPENRYFNNKNEVNYDNININILGNFAQDIPLFQFGSSSNAVLKSVKASTDDNKITSESIQATNVIVNSQNQNKDKRFDCSLLAVMQGRSYKIGLDILGNAQLFPTQLIAIDRLPIFNGLYQIMKVKHTITANHMDTYIEAIKLKYDGNSFVSIPPITLGNFFKNTTSISPSSSDNTTINEPIITPTSESIYGTDGLNYEFLQRVKNEKFRNSSEVNAFIKKLTSYKDFPSWFNSELYRFGDTLFGNKIVSENWTEVWDNIIPIEWEKYGSEGVNILEFLCINSIIYNEVGGNYNSISEKVGNDDNPGITYAYNRIPNLKASYNYNKRKLNETALVLYNDINFIKINKNKKFGNDSRVLKSRNPDWGSEQFPIDNFTSDLKQATSSNNSTFINEADFFKFRGRGFIQTTWRENYRDIVYFIINYTGNDSIILNFKGIWKNSPYNADIERILTMSTNDQWNNLFKSKTICAVAMKTHATPYGYQYITDLSAPKERLEKKVVNIATKINGCKPDAPYANKFRNKIYVQLDALDNSGKKLK